MCLFVKIVNMRTYLRVLSFVKPYWWLFLLSIFCSIFLALTSGASLGMISPFLNAVFQNRPFEGVDILTRLNRFILKDDPFDTLKRLCAIIIVVFFFKGLFTYLHKYLTILVEQHVVKDVRNKIYSHLHALSLSFFHKEKVGTITSRVTNDVQFIRGSFNEGLSTLVKESLALVIYASIVIWMSWRLALLSLLVIPFCVGLIVFLSKRLRRWSTKIQEKMADVTTTLTETVSGIKVVKAFSMEHFEIKKFFRNTWDYFKAFIRFQRLGILGPPLTEFFGVIAVSIILLYGGHQILVTKTLSPDRFLIFLAATLSLMHPLKSISHANVSIQRGISAGKRIFEILDTKPKVKDVEDGIELNEVHRGISVKNVNFRYDTGTEVLKNVSLKINKGDMIALVGPSGGGKSTLVDLIMRFYDPTSGSIEIDGVDLKKMKIKSLRDLMGIVTQETILFNETVFNNISYGRQGASFEEVVNVAKIANAHQFITDMPERYDTIVGERGVKLSGGERQRLAIARAILRNPPILIFDEATSALDSESERLVQEAIDRLMRGRTALVIAHRLSTVRKAKKIVVIDDGRIVEEGTHPELIRRGGLYRKLYDMQFNI